MAYLVPLGFYNAMVEKAGTASIYFQNWLTTFLQRVATDEELTAGLALKADAQAPVGAPHTIPLAKITGGGTDGSITINAQGVVTAFVDPT